MVTQSSYAGLVFASATNSFVIAFIAAQKRKEGKKVQSAVIIIGTYVVIVVVWYFGHTLHDWHKNVLTMTSLLYWTMQRFSVVLIKQLDSDKTKTDGNCD